MITYPFFIQNESYPPYSLIIANLIIYVKGKELTTPVEPFFTPFFPSNKQGASPHTNPSYDIGFTSVKSEAATPVVSFITKLIRKIGVMVTVTNYFNS